MENLFIVSTVADSSFAEDIVIHCNQEEDYSDLISLKCFLDSVHAL